jgi:hypothetical protein
MPIHKLASEVDTHALTASVNEALIGLGDNHHAVAASLESQGVRGLRRNCYLCPLVKFVEKQARGLGKHSWVVTVGSGGWTAACVVDKRTYTARSPLPHACLAFIGAFDTGLFPKLDHDQEPSSCAAT